VSDGKRSFWSSVPGLITGLAGLLTGVVGLITLLVQQGVIGNNSSGGKLPPLGTSVPSATVPGTPGTVAGSSSSTASGTFTVSPTALDFAPTDPRTKAVTVKNTGNVTTLTDFRSTVDGKDAGLFQASLGDCGGPLPANGTCTVKVTFTPQSGAALKQYTARLRLSATPAPAVAEVVLTGSALL
jgi:hypothetical protein